MNTFQHISVAETRRLLADEEVALIDIRDPVSYQNGHIGGALLLDNQSIEHFLDNTPRDMPVVVYCYHGNSSQSAAQYLVDQGFEEVYSMDGGYTAWQSAI